MRIRSSIVHIPAGTEKNDLPDVLGLTGRHGTEIMVTEDHFDADVSEAEHSQQRPLTDLGVKNSRDRDGDSPQDEAAAGNMEFTVCDSVAVPRVSERDETEIESEDRGGDADDGSDGDGEAKSHHNRAGHRCDKERDPDGLDHTVGACLHGEPEEIPLDMRRVQARRPP